jgi:iron(III) transport system substrate-binding protein
MLAHLGAEKTQAWLQGMVSNMARPPKGGDTDQIKAVASGECEVALTNSYYLARMLRSDKPEDRQVSERVGVVLPNQHSTGVHMNIAGGAVAAHAPHRAAAVQFLEYLSNPAAQTYFAGGNNEWPAVSGVALANPALASFGKFKTDDVAVSRIGQNQVPVQEMLDRVGYK